MTGQEIKAEARRAGIYLWQIAKAAGISEPTLTRWLRDELTPEHERRLNEAIKQLEGDQHGRQVALRM